MSSTQFQLALVLLAYVAPSSCSDSLLATSRNAGVVAGAASKQGNIRSSILSADPVVTPHNIRICNAFTDEVPVLVFHRPGHRSRAEAANLTESSSAGALEYKACDDFTLELVRADKLEFTEKHTGQHLGTFVVHQMPNFDALLLLAIHRRGASNRLAFTSHVFTHSTSAQVAALDLSHGFSDSQLELEKNSKKTTPTDGKDGEALIQSKHQVSVLGFNSVVDIKAGEYNCRITKAGNDPKAGNELIAQAPIKVEDGRHFVAIRIGRSDNPAFPEDVMVFPQLSGALLHASPAALVLALIHLLHFL